jgi:hypothetical protein
MSGAHLIAHARDMLAVARTVLTADDERVQAVRCLLGGADQAWAVPCCAEVVHLTRAVHDARDARYAQSRGFRNRLIRLTLISLTALGLLIAAFASNGIPLLSNDVHSFVGIAVLVALFGTIGALITAVPPLAMAPGTWNPFSLTLYQMLLKLVLGAVFAIVGVMLLQSKAIPDVQYPRSLPDLLVWALIFGAAQYSVTRVVDRRAAGIASNDPNQS